MPANNVIARQQVNKYREAAASAELWRQTSIRQKIMMEGLVKMILQLEADSRAVESELYELGITNPAVVTPSAAGLATSEMLAIGVESLKQQRQFNRHIVSLLREANSTLSGIIEDTSALVSVVNPREDFTIPDIEGVQTTSFETLLHSGQEARTRRKEQRQIALPNYESESYSAFLDDINQAVNA